MATKTISLELDAYEKLKRAKRGSESFSEVVRRARFDAEESTGERILEEMASLYGLNHRVPKKTFDYWENVRKTEERNPNISASPWD